ncbi:MAG: double zinc ribbon domain-containing protein, partial [Rhodobiaceae bacterium]
MALKTMINQSCRTLLSWLANALVPPACPVCLKPVAGDVGLCAACWRNIQFISGPVCRRTGLPMP